MKVFISEIKEHFKGRYGILAVMLLGFFTILYEVTQGKISVGFSLAIIPIGLLVLSIFIKRPWTLFFLVFVFNYIIMGATRYISISVPISVMMEFLMIITIFVFGAKLMREKTPINNTYTMYLALGTYLIWTIFCILQIFNDATGTGLHISEWYKDFRPLALYSFYVMLIYFMAFRSMKEIRRMLILFGVLAILAVFKAYWQRNQGFDQAEWTWLMAGGMRTHFINSGVRYFSFFSDAANFGSHMAASLVMFTATTIYEKNKYYKIFWVIVALACGYGMMVSGTRSAIFVAIVGFVAYAFITKNIKLCFIFLVGIIAAVIFLKFSTIGDSNSMIRRMRTAFDPNDASLQVRLENQKAIKSYMREAPWGIGLGRDGSNVPNNNKFWIVATTAPDSTLVYLWMRTGELGLTCFLAVNLLLLAYQAFILMFKIKNKRLRWLLSGFTSAAVCMLVGGYGNNIMLQYPNMFIFYGLQAIVLIGPHFDKEITDEENELIA